MKNKKVAIIGLGLIGGSIALNLKGKVKKIIGIDKDKKTISLALKKKTIDCSVDNIIELKNIDIIIFALYPKDTINFILKNINIWHKKQLLMDVSGLKQNIVSIIQKELFKKNIEFIGTHPIAGMEEKGFLKAKKNLFFKSNLIITPTKKNTKVKINIVKKIGKFLGVKNIYEICPTEHDNIISYTSHLPHILSCAYISNYCSFFNKGTGGSFKDITRIAKINENLWSELLLINKNNNIKELDTIINKLIQIKKFLKENNEKQIKKFLIKSRKIKEGIDI